MKSKDKEGDGTYLVNKWSFHFWPGFTYNWFFFGQRDPIGIPKEPSILVRLLIDLCRWKARSLYWRQYLQNSLNIEKSSWWQYRIFTSCVSNFGTWRYSECYQRKKENTKQDINPLTYNSVLPARYASVKLPQVFESNQSIYDLTYNPLH